MSFRSRVFSAMPAAALLAAATLAPCVAQAADPASYLPLGVGYKWVLRNAQLGASMTIQVADKDATGYRFHADYPWGQSDWVLAGTGGRFTMAAYGSAGQTMALPAGLVYLDFTVPAATTWQNMLGTLSIVSQSATVQTGTRTYAGCTEIAHNDLFFTFCPGIGYAQFGEGVNKFVLDEGSSTLPKDNLRIGLTPNRFAYEPMTVDVMMQRFQQTVDAGISMFVGSGEWASIETAPGVYDLSGVKMLDDVATQAGVPVLFTLRGINTVARDVPADLQTAKWDSTKMRSRALRLVDAIAPILKNHVRWFNFGYEVDGYFATHPDELKAFVTLHKAISDRVKALIPGVQVSCTLTFSAAANLNGSLAPLNSQLDYLAFTYSPLNPDFTVQDPSAAVADISKMKAVAAARKLLLQEVAYPSSSISNSSEDKQAQFYQVVFAELARDPIAFFGANFMMLADLSAAETDQFAQYYGLQLPAFRADMQTLGMFDETGRPKLGWYVFQSTARSFGPQP